MIDENQNSLKRCPFCGGLADLYEVKTQKPTKMMKVQCESCKAQMGLFVDSDKGERDAVETWNKRISDMPTIDYGVSNYYWQILHDINPKLADDASEMVRKQVTGEKGRGVAVPRERPNILDYELPVSTAKSYEAMLKERERTISDLKSSVTRYRNLYDKEKNLIGKKKVAITVTNFTKVKNIMRNAEELYVILDESFREAYGDDYDKKPNNLP